MIKSPFEKRTGGKPDEATALSAESCFKSYAHAMRRKLMCMVVTDQRALGAIVYHLLETPEAKESGKLRFVDKNQRLKVGPDDLHFESGMRLGDAVAAAVDTLLLRYIVARFLEAYYPEAKAERDVFGVDGMPFVDFSATELEAADIFSRDLCKAAQAIQKELARHSSSRGSKLRRDFVSRTGDAERARCGFRYEDLRPKALQDYYESSLATAVRLTYDKESDNFEIDVVKNKGQRKELGAYYTEERLCRLMVERAIKPLFEERLDLLRQSIASRNIAVARKAFDAIVNFSVCDPAMGSAPFLRSAFDYLSEQYARLCRLITEAKSSIPAFYDEVIEDLSFFSEEKYGLDEESVGGWQWHILRQMLYGIDIDLKAVNVACQTFTLSSLKYIRQAERFPSFFNVNLKPGNALISPTKPDDRLSLSLKYAKEIAELIKLRRESKTLPNTEQAYEKLAALFKKIEDIKTPIMRELVQERLAPLLGKYPDELRPFCWELEFPELFFNADGGIRQDAGFDVIIGNPPWESLEVETNEFFEQFHKGYSTLKPASRKTEVQKKLLADHRIERAFRHRNETIESLVRLVKPEAGFFELQHTVLDGERKRSEYATYKMIVEQCLRLTKPGGRLSLIVPSGFTGDLGCYLIRRRMFETCDLSYIRGFRKSSGIFVDVTQAFCIFCAEVGKVTDGLTCLTGLSSIDDLERQDARAVPFPVEMVKRMSPLSWAIPSISDARKFSILEKLYMHPLLNERTIGSWNIEMSYAELNAHNHAEMFYERGWDIPIWEGKLINAYERAAKPHVGAKRREFSTLKRAGVIGSTRVVLRGIAGSDDPRRMMATVLPPQFAIMHSLNYLEPEIMHEVTKIFIVACLNSFVLEWRVRQLATNNNISGFVIRQLPVPRLTEGNIFFDEIVARSASLLLADGELLEPFKELKVKPITDPRGRAKLRCEIDARIAAMYGLTEAELQLILDTFSEVDALERQAVMRAFREVSPALRA